MRHKASTEREERKAWELVFHKFSCRPIQTRQFQILQISQLHKQKKIVRDKLSKAKLLVCMGFNKRISLQHPWKENLGA